MEADASTNIGVFRQSGKDWRGNMEINFILCRTGVPSGSRKGLPSGNQRRTIRFFLPGERFDEIISYLCRRTEFFCPRHIENKEALCCLVNGNLVISNHEQGLHDGSHAMAWAAITTSVRKVFSGPPLKTWH